MAPSNVSSKGKAKPSSKPSGAPRSRNTTPLSNIHSSVEPASASPTYFRSPLTALSRRCDSVQDTLDRGSSGQPVPSSGALTTMRELIESKVLSNVQDRVARSESLLRELQTLRKNHIPHEREKSRVGDKDSEERKHKLKKMSKKREPDEERPLAEGAHRVARQDGVNVHKDDASTRSSPLSQAPPSATGTGPENGPSPSASDGSHQPAPAPSVPIQLPFGPDPSKFNDPTIYHIREVTPGMTEDEMKEIYCVADYPRNDLRDRHPGTPPNTDFTTQKPQNQISASIFANYVEPYIRPLTEEDVAFLKERGDRTRAFAMPARGNRHYKEIWAEEDGAMHIDSSAPQYPSNQARGAYEDINDDFLETEGISAGPLLSRLLCTLRPEGRGNANGSQESNGDAMDIDEGPSAPADANNTNSLPAATQISEFLQPGWKPPQPSGRVEYANMEDRVLMELKHYGLISDADLETQDYDLHFDDEVAVRLRFLQQELRKQSIANGARKQQLLQLSTERIALQEYNTISDDLDNQLNAAYLKRNRNIGKGKKQTKRPGGAGGGSHPVPNTGITRPGVGEPIRTLMERKQQWNETIGPVVHYGKTGLPSETVFPEEKMKELENKEVELWNAEAEQ